MKHDLRTSLAAKCAAIVLLFLSAIGAALTAVGAIAIGSGYGTAKTFYTDKLCTEPMDVAMSLAFYQYLNQVSSSSLEYYYETDFSAEIYVGSPQDGDLAYVWGTPPVECGCQQTLRMDDGSVYYTVVGYLPRQLSVGGAFQFRATLYNMLFDHTGGGMAAAAILLGLIAAGLLLFLLCAAGHKKGVDGIALNRLDRVPLDLYGVIAFIVAAFIVSVTFDDTSLYGSTTVLLPLLQDTIGLLAMGAILLATLLTLAARAKKGKWWRNTVCYQLLRLCTQLGRWIWRVTTHFIQSLPLTWRYVAGMGALLLVQSIITILFLISRARSFYFFLLLVLDIALMVGTAWVARQLQQVRAAGHALAQGDLNAKIDTKKLFWEIKEHAADLNAIGKGMNVAVEQRLKSERLKTELITNVSHDIKTPLTAIVSYVDLLKKEELPPTAEEYLKVLDRQANRLKKLTEDLVEASKASTGNINVHLEPILINEIVHQAVGDYDDRLTAGRLEVVASSFEGNLVAMADGRLLWRVLDNLLNNICKYALAGTRVYVDLGTRDGQVFLNMKNISRDQLNISADELVERFVRGDISRHTEGSGLGLNIARSLIDLMGGNFCLSVDGDLFKAEISLPAVPEKEHEIQLTS